MFNRIPREIHLSENRTSLSVLELTDVPFVAQRLYWINSIMPSEPRGFHAHKSLNQVLIVVAGSIRLKLCRGAKEYVFTINSSDSHIFIPLGTWREIYALEAGTNVLVIADCRYDENDYIRNWDDYLKWYLSSINDD